MFDLLEKYKQKGHFQMKASDRLADVCNAPNNCSGLYIIYALEQGKVNLIYIGISGRSGTEGEIIHRKGGIRGRFLSGKQFGDRRSITWPRQMELENIEALDIYWYITHGEADQDLPARIEATLLRDYFAIYGQLPRWNKTSGQTILYK
jgi:hypothetical protein